MSGPLLLVGCGKMGGSLLRGWLAQGIPTTDVQVVEPAPVGLEDAKVSIVGEPGSLDPTFMPAVVVFAVKPQVMDDVAPAFGRYR
ncbi:MAG: NAD(P)-binding domain-containing protein, partial [Alphaproteobacteria bacterium]